MNFTYDTSLSTQAVQWIKDAIALDTYPLASLPEVTVTFLMQDTLPVPGHSAYMCTVENSFDSAYSIHMYKWAATSSAAPPNDSLEGDDLKRFFQESIAHELGHVTQYALAPDPGTGALATICAMFVNAGDNGTPGRNGTLADFSPDGAAWEDRIQEAIAETIKDLFVPYSAREYDNRTNWTLDPTKADDFAHALERLTYIVSAGGTTTTTTPAAKGTHAHTSIAVNFPDIPPIYTDTAPWVTGVILEMRIRKPVGGDHVIFNQITKQTGGDVFDGFGDEKVWAQETTWGAGDPDTGFGSSEIGDQTYPVWLHIDVDLVTGAVTASLTQDEAGTSVLQSDSWNIAIAGGGPFACPTTDFFMSEFQLTVGGGPGHHFNPAIVGPSVADWRFTSDQSVPNSISEQFTSAADNDNYDAGALGENADGMAWTGSLHFTVDGTAHESLRTTFPVDVTTTTTTPPVIDTFPFVPPIPPLNPSLEAAPGPAFAMRVG